jgi:hypothetical protein
LSATGACSQRASLSLRLHNPLLSLRGSARTHLTYTTLRVYQELLSTHRRRMNAKKAAYNAQLKIKQDKFKLDQKIKKKYTEKGKVARI